MNYEKACQSDILECIKLKNNVISHLKSIGVNIWDEDYPSDELIKNDILFYSDIGNIICPLSGKIKISCKSGNVKA